MSDPLRIALLCVTALLPFVVFVITGGGLQANHKLNLRTCLLMTVLWLAAFAVFAGFGVDSQIHFHAEGHHHHPISPYWGVGGVLTAFSAWGMLALADDSKTRLKLK